MYFPILNEELAKEPQIYRVNPVFNGMFGMIKSCFDCSLNRWDRWYKNHPIGSIYHLYITYSACQLGKLYATDPTLIKGTKKLTPLVLLMDKILHHQGWRLSHYL